MKRIQIESRITIGLLIIFLSAGTSLMVQGQSSPSIVWIAWSPDGTKIATILDNALQVSDAQTNKVLFAIADFLGRVDSLTWKPDSSRIASYGSDGLIRIWDANSGHLVKQLSTELDPMGRGLVAWSPDGTKLASVLDSESAPIHIWTANNDDYRLLAETGSAAFYGIAWSPDSKSLAVGGIVNLYVYDLKEVSDGKLPWRTVGPFALSVAWSPDGAKLAGGTADGSIYIADAKTGQTLRTLKGHQISVDAVHWMDDNQTLISTSVDGTLRIWNTVTGETLKTLPIKSARASQLFDLSPYEGQLIYAAADEVNQPASRITTIIPLPSVEKLQAITKRCAKPGVQQTLSAKLDAKQLPTFTSAVKALTSDQIPPACAADLVAVAEALQAKP